MANVEKITIRGFKSIEKLENFPLGSLNVLVGANGSGKSNFVDFFRFFGALVFGRRAESYLAKNRPTDGLFFNGVSFTRRIEYEVWSGGLRTGGAFETSSDGTFHGSVDKPKIEADGVTAKQVRESGDSVFLSARDLWRRQVYHFHDTSMTAGMRREVGVEQSAELQPDASNLAAFLLELRQSHREHYDLLRETVQRIAPYFDDFELRITKGSPEDTVRLTWRKKGSDYIFSPGHLSDGTIRFICLALVLSQPNPPFTIVLDEPELGLHPEALMVLAGLVRSASARMQVVLATQSPTLLSEFEPEQIITVDQVDGASQFNRLDAVALEEWLDDFTLGELWQKGTLRGGVNHA